MATHHETRQSIARCCANILYGNYSRKQSPANYPISHTFTGIDVSFLDTLERIEFAKLINEHLGSVLDKHHKVDSIIVATPSDDENKDKILIIGNIRIRRR